MRFRALGSCLAFGFFAVGLAGPTLGQVGPRRGDDAALMRAEMRMLTSLVSKQNQQIKALDKQIAALASDLRQLTQLCKQISEAQAKLAQTPRPAPVPTPGPLPARAAAPTPPLRPGTAPVVRAAPKPVERPKADFGGIASLLNAIPVNLLSPSTGAGAARRTELAERTSLRHAGKTLVAEIVVASVQPGAKGAVEVTGTANAHRRNKMVKCSLLAAFAPGEGAKLKEVAPGQSILVIGNVAELQPSQAGGSDFRISLSKSRLVSVGSAARAATPRAPTLTVTTADLPKEKFASIDAMMRKIPREYTPRPSDAADVLARRKAQLEAWFQRELVGSVLRAKAAVSGAPVSGAGAVVVQLKHGPPEFQTRSRCDLKASFSGGEGAKAMKLAVGSHLEMLGTVTAVRSVQGGRDLALRMELNNCHVVSSGPGTGARGKYRMPSNMPRPQGRP